MDDVTLWALAVLAATAGTLSAVWWLEERRAQRVTRPVRVRLHSAHDRQQSTQRLTPTPPPDLKHGGVVGRPRAVFLGDDGEWVGNIHR
jgi:hypothetical protein